MNDIGIIGLGVMGKNLALNIEGKGFKVSCYDYFTEAIKNFKNQISKEKNIEIFTDLEEFVKSLKEPKKILLMIKAGEPVDNIINKLIPLLKEGDIIIDGGNSFFKDTIRRYNFLKSKLINFIGAGISGGEKGALEGPSIMPGGNKKAYDKIKDILIKISAKFNSQPCCTYIGPDGSGHFVKMVHNGIEYADMQIISEAYFLIKELTNISNEEIADIFREWNKFELKSYLIEITSKILKKKDEETGKYLIDLILDKASHKGTGQWTSQVALELGVPIPTIAEAVFARYLSFLKDERIYASKIFSLKERKRYLKNDIVEKIRKALYASKISIYAQGFSLLKFASDNYKWDLKYSEISAIWRNGCIIRAYLLDKIKDAFERDSNLTNLLLDNYFKGILENSEDDWREIVKIGIENSIPVMGFYSALYYYDAYKSKNLPANLIQAQRDFFGAHTYERIDKKGSFHTNWE